MSVLNDFVSFGFSLMRSISTETLHDTILRFVLLSIEIQQDTTNKLMKHKAAIFNRRAIFIEVAMDSSMKAFQYHSETVCCCTPYICL